MKNKKAFLLGEYTLKIIIGVLCLLLLVYLLYGLYSNSKDERNLKMAEATLDELVEGMNKARESGNSEAIILNPGKWNIIAWPYKDRYGRPLQCGISNCICICVINEKLTDRGRPKTQKFFLKKCDSLGVCEIFDEEIGTGGSPIIIEDSPLEIGISYQNNKFTISRK